MKNETPKGSKNHQRISLKRASKKGGRIITSHGYVKLRVGKSHPLADSNGYAYEHQVVIAEIHGVDYLVGKLVHHINQNKQSNEYSNLAVTTRSQHQSHHVALQARSDDGRFKKEKSNIR